MGQISQRAMSHCLDRAYEDLCTYIQTYLYDAYSPTDYERSKGLLYSWRTVANITSGELTFISPQPQISALGQHTSIMGQGSLDEDLLGVLEAGYRGFNAKTGKEIPARPFWDKWINERASRYIGAWYREGLEIQGLHGRITGR